MALAIELESAAAPSAGGVTAAAWRDDAFDFWAFDRAVDALAARGDPLRISAPADEAAQIMAEIAIRTQRLAPRRTPASEGAWFDRVLADHRALHDLDRPLVRADYDHALDAWQWAVRRDPDAPAALQLAVLVHDVERLASEADARVEHLAADYQAFKDDHARAGAYIAGRVLTRAGVAPALVDEVCALIAVHERASEVPALRALNDADALSFFSFNAPGYLAYFGPARTRAKVAYTLGRMSPGAKHALHALRMPAAVRAAIAELGAGELHRDHRA